MHYYYGVFICQRNPAELWEKQVSYQDFTPSVDNPRTMGYLDNLKKQSDSLRVEEQAEQQRQAEREAYYRSHIVPALESIYTYLREFTDHLNHIKPNILVDYPLQGYGVLHNLHQSNYSLFVDSRENMKVIALKFQCSGEEPACFGVEGMKNVTRQTDYLNSIGIPYELKQIRDENHGVISAEYTISNKIQIKFEFIANIKKSLIDLQVKNFLGFSNRHIQIKPEEINSDFLDKLARFIAREESDFFTLDISQEQRNEIKAHLAEDKKRREEELHLIEQQEKEEAERLQHAKNNNVLDLLKKIKKE